MVEDKTVVRKKYQILNSIKIFWLVPLFIFQQIWQKPEYFDWQLKNHLTKHKNSNKKGFSCKTCFRTFTNKDSLLDHVCKHYTCNICEAKFLRERNLKLHKRIHSGENVFDCDICEALFVTKKRLNSHKSTTHSDLKKWTCKECPRAFKTSSGKK